MQCVEQNRRKMLTKRLRYPCYRTSGGVAEDQVSQVRLAVGVRLVGHGRPGQVHHVQRHEARLQQSGVGLVFLKKVKDQFCCYQAVK